MGADGLWEVAFLVTNEGADSLGLVSARLPHGQFRGDEVRFDSSAILAPAESFSFHARVRCHEPPGLVTENAFVILLVKWMRARWRIFVRLRIQVETSGIPRAFAESVTTQEVGFSGVGE